MGPKKAKAKKKSTGGDNADEKVHIHEKRDCLLVRRNQIMFRGERSMCASGAFGLLNATPRREEL